MQTINKKGFTLVELLIVMGILAVLATATAIILNPGELLAQSRDARRVADLNTVYSAIDLYLSGNNTSGGSKLGGAIAGMSTCVLGGSAATVWAATSSPSAAQPVDTVPFAKGASSGSISSMAAGAPAIALATQPNVDNTGWVPVNFNETTTVTGSATSPIAKLPLDPNPNNGVVSTVAVAGVDLTSTGRYYAYTCNALTYEIAANMESVKYSKNGSGDVESTDGGIIGCGQTTTQTASNDNICSAANGQLFYQVGTKLSL